MTKKKILHKILKGMDPYLSCGVPAPFWKLAIKLTKKIYGDEGVEILERFHETYDGSVEANKEIILHTINGSDASDKTLVGPKEVIKMLEQSKGWFIGLEGFGDCPTNSQTS